MDSARGREDGLFVEGHVDGVIVHLLIDSGAVVSVISPETYSKINRATGKRVKPTQWQVKSASGDPLTVQGQMQVKLVTAQLEWPLTPLVANIKEDGILGMDFLGDAIIDCKKKSLKLQDKTVPLLGKKADTDKSCYKLYIDRTVELPEHGEIFVTAKTTGDMNALTPLLVENNVSNEGFAVEDAVVDPAADGTVSLRLLNLSETPLKLRKGTQVARCEEMTDPAIEIRLLETERKKSKELPRHLKELFRECSEFLVGSEAEEARKILQQFQHVFSAGPSDLGRTQLAKHKIDTGDARPVRIPPRRIPLSKQKDAARCVEDMKRQQIIVPSNSPWSAPIILVKKKDNTTRFCVDYRGLNEVTKKDSFPLPRIDTVLDSLAGSSWFSTLDLKSGYWQVGMDPKDQEKTAFSALDQLWEFSVMPFGLCNSPATFSRLMDQVLRGVPSTACMKYLDDLIVHGRTFSDMVENLRDVLRKLESAGLKLNPRKCNLFQRQVSYLGHTVNAKGVSTDPEKVAVVRKWPQPQNKKQVRSFLGLSSYYRRFIPAFADIARPLHELTEERSSFVWTKRCQDSFEELKKRLTSAPILALPKHGDDFILDTDASDEGVGAVLSQLIDGQERVVAYYSQALSKPERNYCVTRKELLAVIKSIGHFHHYLYGQKFSVRVDHSALQWLMKFKNPEGQIARWIQTVQDYDFTIIHRAGKKHGNADAMSRRPCPDDCRHCSRAEMNQLSESGTEGKRCPLRRTTIRPEGVSTRSLEDLKRQQEQDPTLRVIISLLKTRTARPEWKELSPQTTEVKSLWKLWNSLELRDGVLYYKWESAAGNDPVLLRVLPKAMRRDAWEQLHVDHGGGHMGTSKTMSKLRARFFWVGQRLDVRRWCESCHTCQSKKGPAVRRRAPMKQYNVGYPGERVAIDVLGPLPESDAGNRYLLVLMDYFTKWPEAYALPNQEARTVATAMLQGFVSRFGVPHELHSDQGRNFESAVFKGICDLLGVKKTRTTPLRPQSDGMVERYNRTIGNQLAMYAQDDPTKWDQHVPMLLLAYRSAAHEGTGETPAKLMLGRELTLPIDLFYGLPEAREKFPSVPEYLQNLEQTIQKVHDFARRNIQNMSNRAKARYDLRTDSQKYDPGDRVWLYNPQRKKGVSPKLTCPWRGPYVILTCINDVVYRVKEGSHGKPLIVHSDRLKPFREMV